MTRASARLSPSDIRAAVLPFTLISVLCLAPLPLGSVNPIAVAIWTLVLGAALVTADLRSLTRPCDRAFVIAVAVIALGYAIVVHEQLSARPWIGGMHPIWGQAATVLHTSVAPSVSIMRNEAWYGIGTTLLCLLASLAGYIVGCDRRRGKALLRAIVISGGLYALFAIISFLINPAMVFAYEKLAHQANLTTPFVNRNTAAIYYGSCAIVAVMRLLDRQERPSGWLGVLGDFATGAGPFKWPDRQEAEAALAGVLCLIALLLTSSRAGVVLSLGGLVLACALFQRRRGAPGRFALYLLGGGALALLVLQTAASGVTDRFDQNGLTDAARIDAYRATISMIAASPALGTGLGTFVAAFPPFRLPEASMWGIWDRAHDTILEIASDGGVPLAALVVLAWLVALGGLVRGALYRRRDRLFSVGALAVALVAIIHSMIDFPLQIPGYAVVVMTLVGVGLAQSFSFANPTVNSGVWCGAESVGHRDKNVVKNH